MPSSGIGCICRVLRGLNSRCFATSSPVAGSWLQKVWSRHVPKRQNIPRPPGCRGRYRIIIVQVDRVVRKQRPNVELGDGGIWEPRCTRCDAKSGRASTVQMTPRSLAGIGTSARPASTWRDHMRQCQLSSSRTITS